MDIGDVGKWVEQHPYATGGIVFGGGLVLLWAFGYLGGGSSSSAAAGTSNLAAAYYAAEAAQTTAGTQLQMATVAADASQGIATTQANAAVAINKAQYDAATTVNGQNASASTTIAQSADWAGTTQSTNQLLATYSNNQAATDQANSNTWGALQKVYSDNQTQLTLAALNGIIPQELVLSGGQGAAFSIPGVGQIAGSMGAASPNTLAAAGYTPAQIAAMYG